MNADLERLIALQTLDTVADAARRKLAEQPSHEQTLETRLATARDRVAADKARLADNQQARREIEKEVAVHQGRLSKFREQAMAVKTNQEYHAVQKEIGFAQGEIKTLEDKILERMLEADELTAALKRAETQLAAEQKAVEADRKTTTVEESELKATVERIAGERETLVKALNPQLLVMFEQVSRKRNGIAVSEARDGVCSICHVRLRPQVFNTVRRNDAIIQCDHCNRILYFVPLPAVPPAAANSATPTAP
jgi:predicted  nucleic acid-binding Zn-ribbon protein